MPTSLVFCAVLLASQGVIPKPNLSKLLKKKVELQKGADEVAVIPETVMQSADVPGVTVRDEEDQTRFAIEYFASERVPAALIAGAVLGLMFAYPLQDADSPRLALMKRVYMVLTTAAFSHTMLSVFAASLAIVRLLGHAHEPIAKDPLLMMLREVPLYFLAVRTHYLTGVLTFTLALAVRMWTEYSTGHPHFARAMLCLMIGTLFFMISMYNITLIHFKSFVHLWTSYVRCIVMRVTNRNPKYGKPAGPIAFIAFAFTALALWELFFVMKFFVVDILDG